MSAPGCLLRVPLRTRTSITASLPCRPRKTALRCLSTTSRCEADYTPGARVNFGGSNSSKPSTEFSPTTSKPSAFTSFFNKPTSFADVSASIDNIQPLGTEAPAHRLCVYSTKHNTHLTLTSPEGNPIISKSCGNIGFKKGGRGSFDAAYQLSAFTFNQIQEKGLIPKIRRLDLIFRGFGPGREAVQKALLGTEGMNMRKKVAKVMDSTRLKFGGARSPAPRRLG